MRKAAKIDEVLQITQALSDSNRVRILNFVRSGELCVCQIVKVLGLAPSTVSKHLAILEGAGLLVSRKEGRWIHYRRPDREANPCIRDALRWLDCHLSGDACTNQDRREAAKTVRLGAEEVSKIYQCKRC